MSLEKAAEKVNFHRLLKNAQMLGSSFDRLRINSTQKDEGWRRDE
jgi:hypothetical protein